MDILPFANEFAVATDQRWRELLARITIRPDQLGGVPCVRGMRLPVTTILGGLAEGLTPEQIMAHYPSLELDDIRAACAFAVETLDPD